MSEGRTSVLKNSCAFIKLLACVAQNNDLSYKLLARPGSWARLTEKQKSKIKINKSNHIIIKLNQNISNMIIATLSKIFTNIQNIQSKLCKNLEKNSNSKNNKY